MKKTAAFFIITLFLLFLTFSYFNTFAKLENATYDMALQDKRPTDERILIVGIDANSIEELGSWPWTRNYMAEMVNKLTNYGAAAIGIDVIYNSEGNPEHDKMLVDAIGNNGNVVTPVSGKFLEKTKEKGIPKAYDLMGPFLELGEVSALGHINIFADSSQGLSLGVDSDGVVRKGVKTIDYYGTEYESFDVMIYRKYCEAMGIEPTIDIRTNTFGQFYINFVDGPETFPMFSFSAVLNGDYEPEVFKDAIVLIGPYNEGVGKDFYYTSIDTQAPMYGIEIHANILQNIMENSHKVRINEMIGLLLFLLYGLAALYAYSKLNPYISAGAMIGFIIFEVYFAKIMYKNFDYVLQIFHPILFIILLYFVVLIYKYILELTQKKLVTDMFGRYLAPEVVNTLIKGGRESLELAVAGRELTVLFVDIRGFTSLSEKSTPEKVVQILNKYLTLTSTAIFDNKGTLDKYIGDATMAFFNAPELLPDHAIQAVRAAWQMKQKGIELMEEIKEEFGVELKFGIGINTGYAVVGNIGAAFRMDYTAIGDTVNTAARLESNAKAGEILISDSTYRQVESYVKASCMGNLSVKGKMTQILVYNVEEVY